MVPHYHVLLNRQLTNASETPFIESMVLNMQGRRINVLDRLGALVQKGRQTESSIRTTTLSGKNCFLINSTLRFFIVQMQLMKKRISVDFRMIPNLILRASWCICSEASRQLVIVSPLDII